MGTLAALMVLLSTVFSVTLDVPDDDDDPSSL